MGRPYAMEPEDDVKIKEAVDRFYKLFASDDRCSCLIGVFEVEYATQDRVTRLRR